jgi:hypothetical protein
MKIRYKLGGPTAHAELWDSLPDDNLCSDYPAPTLVYFESAGVESGDEVRNIPLGIEQAEDWELVLADPDEQRRLREAGYCFD